MQLGWVRGGPKLTQVASLLSSLQNNSSKAMPSLSQINQLTIILQPQVGNDEVQVWSLTSKHIL